MWAPFFKNIDFNNRDLEVFVVTLVLLGQQAPLDPEGMLARMVWMVCQARRCVSVGVCICVGVYLCVGVCICVGVGVYWCGCASVWVCICV